MPHRNRNSFVSIVGNNTVIRIAAFLTRNAVNILNKNIDEILNSFLFFTIFIFLHEYGSIGRYLSCLNGYEHHGVIERHNASVSLFRSIDLIDKWEINLFRVVCWCWNLIFDLIHSIIKNIRINCPNPCSLVYLKYQFLEFIQWHHGS